jgi:hypothetical protein
MKAFQIGCYLSRDSSEMRKEAVGISVRKMSMESQTKALK